MRNTHFFETSGSTIEETWARHFMKEPSEIAAAVVGAARSRRAEVHVGAQTRILPWSGRYLLRGSPGAAVDSPRVSLAPVGRGSHPAGENASQTPRSEQRQHEQHCDPSVRHHARLMLGDARAKVTRMLVWMMRPGGNGQILPEGQPGRARGVAQ